MGDTYVSKHKGNEIDTAVDKVYELNDSVVSLSVSVNALSKKIPVATSQLTNDSGFVNDEELSVVEAIAKGRATGYVFDDIDDMNAWLEIEENVSSLILGDNLYIRAVDVPDYWWDGTQVQELETQKVNLDEYAGSPYIGDNGTWFEFDDTQQGYVDTGVQAQGHTPIKGVDYYTEAEKAEMVEAVLLALPDGDEVSY